jgi:hypothetical protein
VEGDEASINGIDLVFDPNRVRICVSAQATLGFEESHIDRLRQTVRRSNTGNTATNNGDPARVRGTLGSALWIVHDFALWITC